MASAMPQKPEIIRALAPARELWVQGSNTVQFAVNGIDYFVNFVPEEGQWFVFTATAQGFSRVPVVDDDQRPIGTPVVVISEDEDRKTIN
jgi:hypothetical protein